MGTFEGEVDFESAPRRLPGSAPRDIIDAKIEGREVVAPGADAC